MTNRIQSKMHHRLMGINTIHIEIFFRYGIFILLTGLTYLSGLSQTFQDRHWIFGRTGNSTNVQATFDFFPGLSLYSTTYPQAISPTIVYSGSFTGGTSNFGLEGTAVVTDPRTGDLLFYTDGSMILDELGNPVVGASLGGNASSAQPAAVCVFPDCNTDMYHIFSNGTGHGGFGEILHTTYNATTSAFSTPASMPGPFGGNQVAEGLILIPSSYDPYLFWLICRLNTDIADPATYVVYRIDRNGVGNGVGYSFGPNLDTDNHHVYANMAYSAARGAAPFNVEFGHITAGRINGSLSDNHIITCQFNTRTGEFDISSAQSRFSAGNGTRFYDLEYSPEGDYIYFSTIYNTSLHQLDLSNNTVETIIEDDRDNHGLGGGLKLGPDNFVYYIEFAGGDISTQFGTMHIDRITTPDLHAANGSFVHQQDIASYGNIQGINFPEFTTVPMLNLDVTGGTALCPGEKRTLSTVFVTIGFAITDYQWFSGEFGNATAIPGAKNPTLVVTQPGTYYLVVTTDEGCQLFSREVKLNQKDDCCEITNVSASSVYDATTTNVISSNLTWEGKIYVADGITIQVESGATLDITNVDVAFGECAGIYFEAGSELRANNAVFRACDFDGVWYGLEFEHTTEGSAKAMINECTFKNATVAIGVDALEVAGEFELNIRLTNNLFANCHYGFYPQNSVLDEPITGNTFMVDKHLPYFASVGCENFATEGYNFGIYGSFTHFNDVIGQNDFVHAAHEGVEFAGILLHESQRANIAGNQFLDNVSAIELTNSTHFQIEQNEITVASQAIELRHQVFASNSSNFHISGNELYNLNAGSSTIYSNSGIYVEESNTFGIAGNQIQGFDAAIQLEDNSGFNITDNHITDSWMFGLYLNSSESYYVTCNVIDLLLDDANDVTGIYLNSDASTSGIKSIRNNCISETNQAIHLVGSGAGIGDGLPEIIGNFLYNYVDFGVENVNLNGNIGSGSSHSTAGKNTFSSNNIGGGAVDIYTGTYALIAYGNSGIATISSNITLISSGAFTSSATCAKQLGNALQEIAEDEECDRELPFATLSSSFGSRFKPNSIQESRALNQVFHDSGKMLLLSQLKMDVYPNPTKNGVTVNYHFNVNNHENCTVFLLDTKGQKVGSYPAQGDAGSFTMDLSNLDPGVYFLEAIQDDKVRAYQKIVKY